MLWWECVLWWRNRWDWALMWVPLLLAQWVWFYGLNLVPGESVISPDYQPYLGKDMIYMVFYGTWNWKVIRNILFVSAMVSVWVFGDAQVVLYSLQVADPGTDLQSQPWVTNGKWRSNNSFFSQLHKFSKLCGIWCSQY